MWAVLVSIEVDCGMASTVNSQLFMSLYVYPYLNLPRIPVSK